MSFQLMILIECPETHLEPVSAITAEISRDNQPTITDLSVSAVVSELPSDK